MSFNCCDRPGFVHRSCPGACAVARLNPHPLGRLDYMDGPNVLEQEQLETEQDAVSPPVLIARRSEVQREVASFVRKHPALVASFVLASLGALRASVTVGWSSTALFALMSNLSFAAAAGQLAATALVTGLGAAAYGLGWAIQPARISADTLLERIFLRWGLPVGIVGLAIADSLRHLGEERFVSWSALFGICFLVCCLSAGTSYSQRRLHACLVLAALGLLLMAHVASPLIPREQLVVRVGPESEDVEYMSVLVLDDDSDWWLVQRISDRELLRIRKSSVVGRLTAIQVCEELPIGTFDRCEHLTGRS